MKKTISSGSFFLVSLVLLLVGICAFSIYAHNRIDASRSEKLTEQVKALEAENAELRQNYVEQTRRHNAAREEWESALFAAFPGEENRKWIIALFNSSDEMRNELAESSEAAETTDPETQN